MKYLIIWARVLFAVSAFLLIACRYLYGWAGNTLILVGKIDVFPGVFNLAYGEGKANALGYMLHTAKTGYLPLLMPTLLIILPLILANTKKLRGRFFTLGITLAMTGAISNFLDLIRDGFITDYLELTAIPVLPLFNLPDICIISGLAVLLFYSFFLSGADMKKDKLDELEAMRSR